MKTEKELIGKVRELRQIKPQKDWVALTKTDILGTDPGFTFFPYFKLPSISDGGRRFSLFAPVFAGFMVVFLAFGSFFLIKNSLPGDVLYSVRRVAHLGQAVFISEEEKPVFQLKLANDRLEDLTKAPVKNLAPTIYEFEANIAEAARNLSNIDATTSDSIAMQRIIEETKKLEENKLKVESLGVVLGEEGTNELNQALARIVNNLIKDLEERSLVEEKQEILAQMKELLEKEQYSEALELYLKNQ